MTSTGVIGVIIAVVVVVVTMWGASRSDATGFDETLTERQARMVCDRIDTVSNSNSDDLLIGLGVVQCAILEQLRMANSR